MARSSKSQTVTIDAINDAIQTTRKLSLKDVIGTMPTSKFYEAAIKEKRAVAARKLAQAVFAFANSFEAYEDKDVDEGLRRSFYNDAKELFTKAQRMQNYVSREKQLAAKVEDLRARAEATAAALAKAEAAAARIGKVEE